MSLAKKEVETLGIDERSFIYSKYRKGDKHEPKFLSGNRGQLERIESF